MASNHPDAKRKKELMIDGDGVPVKIPSDYQFEIDYESLLTHISRDPEVGNLIRYDDTPTGWGSPMRGENIIDEYGGGYGRCSPMEANLQYTKYPQDPDQWQP